MFKKYEPIFRRNQIFPQIWNINFLYNINLSHMKFILLSFEGYIIFIFKQQTWEIL